MEKIRSKTGYRIIYAAVWLALWQTAALIAGSDLILPGPLSTASALLELVRTGEFWIDAAWTVIRVVLGGELSFAAGTAAAWLAWKNRALRQFLALPVSFFKSIPVMAVIIYVILIVKADWVAVVVCFFMCFPIAYASILGGLDSLNSEYEELAYILGMSVRQRLMLVIRPQLQPQIRAAADLIAGMSWKVVVAAEVLAIPGYSIGYQMQNSRYYLNTPELFAYIIVLIILSVSMEKLVSLAVETDYRRAGACLRRTVLMSPPIKAEHAREDDASGSERDQSIKEEHPALVILKDVSKSYRSDDGTEKQVLNKVNMEFGEGITALTGPSGIGKTTVMKLIAGLDQPDSGTVRIVRSGSGAADGETAQQDPGASSGSDIRADVLFQEDRLLPWLTAEENMMLAFIGRHESRSKREDPAAVIREMADELEIGGSLEKYPAELSGGMAHRAAIGRALLGGSPLLILDEPMRGLNEDLKERILTNISDELRNDVNGGRRTVILITHDDDLACSFADRTIELRN